MASGLKEVEIDGNALLKVARSPECAADILLATGSSMGKCWRCSEVREMGEFG